MVGLIMLFFRFLRPAQGRMAGAMGAKNSHYNSQNIYTILILS